MSLHHYPKITLENLVLNVDAKNIVSYTGNGTNWIDTSKENNSAILYNTTFNNEDKAIVFGASNSRAVISNYFIENPTQLTISSWFKMTGGNSTYRCVLHKNPTSTTIGGSEYWLGATGGNWLCATIGAVTGVGWQAGETNVNCTLNQWFNIVASWDGLVVRIYVNGKYNKQYDLTTYTNSSSVTRIGASSDSGVYQTIGNVSIVSVYKNKALTDGDVRANFNALRGRFNI